MPSRRTIRHFLFRISLAAIVIVLVCYYKPLMTVFTHTDDGRKRLLLTVGVLSKLSAISRRMAIRATWFNVCKDNADKVVCTFFTDVIDETVPEKNGTSYLKEKEKHNDLVYMPYKGGYNFALRLLWMLKHFTREHDFDFFLRVDDDYFVCLHHLLTELPQRPTNALYWGYLHCTKHVVRVDEGFMILTYDLIMDSLQRLNSSLMCSAFGDQAVALWIADSKLNVTYFSDNNRVIHAATGFKIGEYLVSGLCDRYIGLHGAYPRYMYQYWRLMKQDKIPAKQYQESGRYFLPAIPKFSQVCNFSKEFDWRWFWPEFRFRPKPCKDDPKWTVTVRPFIGREELGHEQIY